MSWKNYTKRQCVISVMYSICSTYLAIGRVCAQHRVLKLSLFGIKYSIYITPKMAKTYIRSILDMSFQYNNAARNFLITLSVTNLKANRLGHNSQHCTVGNTLFSSLITFLRSSLKIDEKSPLLLLLHSSVWKEEAAHWSALILTVWH